MLLPANEVKHAAHMGMPDTLLCIQYFPAIFHSHSLRQNDQLLHGDSEGKGKEGGGVYEKSILVQN